MSTRYNNPHIDISSRLATRSYKSPNQSRPSKPPPRARDSHGGKLRAQLDDSFAAFQFERPMDDRLDTSNGAFIEVELRRGSSVEKLERKRDGVIAGAVNLDAEGSRQVGLFVPDEALPILQSIIDDYTQGPLLEKSNNPPNKSYVEPIEEIRQARLETYWTDDPEALPKNKNDVIWWQVWCVKTEERQLEQMAEAVDARLADRDKRLYFPEYTVIPVLTDRTTMELLLFSRFAIVEIRRATDNPAFFLDELEGQDQIEWLDDLAERIIWPGTDTAAVCLLDTGVNRAHHLIEPALSPNEMFSVDSNWGTDDDTGHGTNMAGISLHGDLVPLLSSTASFNLEHRIESVKILPPTGYPKTLERFYGAITKSAIALPETEQPFRSRVFCMAVTNAGRNGSEPSTWSAAIDEEAAGVSIDAERAPRRLFVVSAGNAPAHMRALLIEEPEVLPIEDPAQSWNAVTVGGYTDKIYISEPDLKNHSSLAGAGELSPHTRTSVLWQKKSPFKPDIVMEAGNRAVNELGTEICTPDSLSVLTTGLDVDQHPLSSFSATSAATADAGRLAARLMSAHPDYWPETIRALMIHGAEWTEPMRAKLDTAGGKTNASQLLRYFGYGVPNFERCNASAINHLALITQSEIQPFKSRQSFQDCHFYSLPWPKEVFEQLGDHELKVKITLSYFIDPNPGSSSSFDPYRYQSHGLRFDLKRRGETSRNFVRRMNVNEWDNKKDKPVTIPDNDKWLFGPDSITAGSLHCDEWEGPATYLLSRNLLCIRPVMGWWRSRASSEVSSQKTRYSLVVTVKSSKVDLDLHTPIVNLVENKVGVDTPFEVQIEGLV